MNWASIFADVPAHALGFGVGLGLCWLWARLWASIAPRVLAAIQKAAWGTPTVPPAASPPAHEYPGEGSRGLRGGPCPEAKPSLGACQLAGATPAAGMAPAPVSGLWGSGWNCTAWPSGGVCGVEGADYPSEPRRVDFGGVAGSPR